MREMSIAISVMMVMTWGSEAYSQTVIQNPLLRPAHVSGGLGAQPAAAATTSRSSETSSPSPSNDSTDDLRDKASARLSQEDFNIRQQALNAANVPAPLVALFSQMAVSAHVSGAVVLRRSDSAVLNASTAVSSGSVSSASNGGAAQPAIRVAQSSASQAAFTGLGPLVLRLKVGRPVNINGYMLRAKVEDFDVTVEWQNEQGHWVTVFFGAVESASAFSLVPVDLEKVDTKVFEYLEPTISSRVLNNGIAGGAGGGGFGGAGGFGSGGGFGGAPSGQQPGFGSTGGVFR